MRTRERVAMRAVAALCVLAAAGCADDEAVDAVSPAVVVPVSDGVPVAGSAGGVAEDPDPYDGIVGEVVLTTSQRAYRDRLGLTDLETHDAFRYSCSIFGLPETFDRFANQPPEESSS